jgi:Fe-S-cluster containining protein
LCCKVFSIDVKEISKPANEWCTHCRPSKGGCSIYADRPSVCRDFVCSWLVDSGTNDHWFPQKSKIVISRSDAPPILHFDVDADYADAWRREPYYQEIKTMALDGLRHETFSVYVHAGNRDWVILPDEDVETTWMATHVLASGRPDRIKKWVDEFEAFELSDQG